MSGVSEPTAGVSGQGVTVSRPRRAGAACQMELASQEPRARGTRRHERSGRRKFAHHPVFGEDEKR